MEFGVRVVHVRDRGAPILNRDQRTPIRKVTAIREPLDQRNQLLYMRVAPKEYLFLGGGPDLTEVNVLHPADSNLPIGTLVVEIGFPGHVLHDQLACRRAVTLRNTLKTNRGQTGHSGYARSDRPECENLAPAEARLPAP